MEAIDANTSRIESSSQPPPSHLTVILDTNPYGWSLLAESSLPLQNALAALLVFVNAHLAFSTENSVAILAAHCGAAHWLYPAPQGDAALPSANANKYRPFAVVEASVLSRIQTLLAHTDPKEVEESGDTCALAGPVSLALTYINRLNSALAPAVASAAPTPAEQAAQARTAGGALAARILIVSVSAADLAGQYIPLTNAMFAAQHARVPLDVLKLAGDTALLQQATFTTGGRYLAPEGLPANPGSRAGAPASLLPILFQALLPDPTARAHMVAPTSPHVDFRAACFCHRRVVDMGYVCSICLSIFCEAEELKEAGGELVCLTCSTRLVLGGEEDELPAESKKKKKKKDKGKDRESGVGTPA